MSTIIANIEDDELSYSYQLCRDDDDTYFLYVESSPLRGKKVFSEVEDLHVALCRICQPLRTRKECLHDLR